MSWNLIINNDKNLLKTVFVYMNYIVMVIDVFFITVQIGFGFFFFLLGGVNATFNSISVISHDVVHLALIEIRTHNISGDRH